jgi:hypothetical protein
MAQEGAKKDLANDHRSSNAALFAGGRPEYKRLTVVLLWFECPAARSKLSCRLYFEHSSGGRRHLIAEVVVLVISCRRGVTMEHLVVCWIIKELLRDLFISTYSG